MTLHVQRSEVQKAIAGARAVLQWVKAPLAMTHIWCQSAYLIPVTLPPTQLPAKEAGKAENNGPGTWTPSGKI